MRIAVVNGPNLNLLGVREPERYGTSTLAGIEVRVRERAQGLGVEIVWFQSNHEGALVEAVQGLRGRADGALVNAAAYTHTSLAVRDALLAVGVVAGFGAESYLLALEGLVEWLRPRGDAAAAVRV